MFHIQFLKKNLLYNKEPCSPAGWGTSMIKAEQLTLNKPLQHQTEKLIDPVESEELPRETYLD